MGSERHDHHAGPALNEGAEERRPRPSFLAKSPIDRGDGHFLCGDQVAADGRLCEVSFASAIEAGKGALEQSRPRTVPQAVTGSGNELPRG